MTALISTLTNRIQHLWNPAKKQGKDHDIEILRAFIQVYCKHHHTLHSGQTMCDECQQLLTYAQKRREACPYDPKPACKNCQTHCYAQRYRTKIKEVMKFSGIYFIKRGRIDWLIKYFLL